MDKQETRIPHQGRDIVKIYNGMGWQELLTGCLREYKAANPGTTMTDREILQDFMEHLVNCGLVSKSADGKYNVPSIGRLQ